MQVDAQQQIEFILQKTKFFNHFRDKLNERRLKVITRILSEGSMGFEGGMSAKKYCVITGTSKAIATRDLQEMLEMNALKQLGEGRSTRYEINLNN